MKLTFITIFLISFTLITRIYSQFQLEPDTIVIVELLVKLDENGEYAPLKIAADKFEDKKYTPLGIRLNNFGCLKTPHSGWWKGQIDKDTNGHAKFSKPIWGIVAFIELTLRYIKMKYNTPFMYISRYAPTDGCIGDLVNPDGSCKIGKNPTMSYVNRISEVLGIDKNDTLRVWDLNGNISASFFSKFLTAIANFELGIKMFKLGIDCKIPESIIQIAIDKVDK